MLNPIVSLLNRTCFPLKNKVPHLFKPLSSLRLNLILMVKKNVLLSRQSIKNNTQCESRVKIKYYCLDD